MPSLVPGFEYDIFISYRQKDNKHDGWVTQFVDNLKGELESTFKEEISVYFDINPHDGLLETHDVDASLKEKLKCLIFIPIISRTYCDPKSFAWEHEFKAFIEQASKDQYGLKIKLPGGNIASRVLPVQIHDLDADDKKTVENELCGFLRGIEFIYKEPGVNRPLMANEDHPDNNLNKSFYRNQMNKVANAINEIITGIRNPDHSVKGTSENIIEGKPAGGINQKTKIIAGTLILLALTVAGYFIVPKLIKPKEQFEKSIAALPFKSLSDDPGNQYLADGMMDAILLHLSKIKNLRVIARTSVEQYRGTTKTTHAIGQELDVEYLLEGSFQKFGDDTKLIVQLIKVSDESHVWANEYNSKWSEVYSLQSEVAQKIASELMVVLTPGEIEKLTERPTENLEAYQAYLRGLYYEGQPHFLIDEGIQAVQGFQDAVDIDTTFALAWGKLARAQARLFYLNYDRTQSGLLKAKQAAENALRLGYDQPRVHIELGYYYLWAFRNRVEALKQFEIAEKSLPNDVEVLLGKSEIIRTSGRWDEYLSMLIKLDQRRPNNVSTLVNLAETYWWTRHYKESVEVFDQAIALSPNNTTPYIYKAFNYMSWKGAGEESREAIKHIGNKNEWYLLAWYFQEIGEGNLQRALQLASDTSLGWGVNNKVWIIPRNLLAAFIYDYQNKPELAHTNYNTAIEILEKKVTQFPNDQRYRGALGIAFAGLGEKEEAIKEGLKAVDLLPISKDALYGLGELTDLAIIYTMVGEFDLAFETLDQLLSIPSWISPAWINMDIRFAPLKSDPGYNKLMKKYEINE